MLHFVNLYGTIVYRSSVGKHGCEVGAGLVPALVAERKRKAYE